MTNSQSLDTQRPPYCYRIKNWDQEHETCESKRVISFDYFMIPNNQSSPAFKRMKRLKNSSEVQVGFYALLQAASQMPHRGILCKSDGPLDIEDIADMTDQSVDVIEAAVHCLTDPHIGLIDVIESPTRLIKRGTGVKGRLLEVTLVEPPDSSKDIPYNPKLLKVKSIESKIDQEIRILSGKVENPKNEQTEIAVKRHKTVLGTKSTVQACPKKRKVKKKNRKKENKISASENAEKNNSSDFYLTKQSRRLEGDKLNRFLSFWNAFDFKKHKTEAADEWLDLNGVTENAFDEIITAARKEAYGRSDIINSNQNPREAANWLKSRSWEDEYYAETPITAKEANPKNWPAGVKDLIRNHWTPYKENSERAEKYLSGPFSSFKSRYGHELKDLINHHGPDS